MGWGVPHALIPPASGPVWPVNTPRSTASTRPSPQIRDTMKIAGVAESAVRAIRRNQMSRWLEGRESTAFDKLDQSVEMDWLAGRVALKQACLDTTAEEGVDPSDIAVDNKLSGVPYVDGMVRIHCSIGHRAGWAVAGVSDEPIGVDIERIGRRREHLLPYITTVNELADLMMIAEELDVLVTTIWTLKEAAMKAWQTGLTLHPKQVKVCWQDSSKFLVHSAHVRGCTSVLNGNVYMIGAFIIAAVSTESMREPPHVHWVDVAGLSAAHQTIS